MLGSAVLGAVYYGSATSQTPGFPPPLPPAQKAKLYARGAIARSNATRSNYIRPHITVLLTKYRYPNAADIVDVTPWTRADTLSVTQALNDQPSSCNFTLTPLLDASNIPQVGDLLSVGLATEGSGANQRIAGVLEFAGIVVQIQHERRQQNLSPWLHLQCADWMFAFDAAIVNWNWPAQSATITIADLLARYVNFSQVFSDQSLVLQFTADFVEANLGACAAFSAINWRPSDVIRHLLTEIQGGWYIDPLRRLHVWSGAIEPQQSDPRPLTNYLHTLKSFTHLIDATQVRRRVVVEGMVTTSAMDVPTLTVNPYGGGVPVGDARAFVGAAGVWQSARFGAQWVWQQITHGLAPDATNLPAGHATRPYAVGDAWLYVDAMGAVDGPVPIGWIKTGEQLIRYDGAAVVTAGAEWALWLNPAIQFGKPSAPIKAGDVVTWIPFVDYFGGDAHNGSEMPLQGTANGSDLVLIADVIDPDASQPWAPRLPPLEALVQDARYSYGGARGRADADLAYFKAPLLTLQWVTEDYNARPGRSQEVQLTDVDPLSAVSTITGATITFPLRQLAPRRACTASIVKPATLLDVLVTNTV